MPIYAYRCSSCGHAQDVLQKMSDPVLSTCPACGAETFVKQLTAAGFQLKGSGWYVTDFRGNGGAGAKKVDADSGGADKGGDKGADKVEGGKSGAGTAQPTADASVGAKSGSTETAAAAPAATAAPAPSAAK